MTQSAFHRFAKEAAIIGRLLLGYAALEIDLLHCVSVASGEFDATLRAMFGIRGERRRINVARSLGRQFYASLNGEFEASVDAVCHCLDIRNRYAHYHGYDDNSGRLAFVNVEQIAKDDQPVSGLGDLVRHYVDVPILEKQEQFFGYAGALLAYANFERRFRSGELKAPIKPPYLERPALDAGQSNDGA